MVRIARSLGAHLVLLTALVSACSDGTTATPDGGDTDAMPDQTPFDVSSDGPPGLDSAQPDRADGPDQPEQPDTDADSADADVDGAIDQPPAIAITDTWTVENPSNVLSYYVGWRTSSPSVSRIVVDCGDDHWIVVDETERLEHEMYVMGLLGGQRCTLGLRARNGELRGERDLEVEVSQLPPSLPTITVTNPSHGAIQPGWTLWNFNGNGFPMTPTQTIIDAQGRYRWYNAFSTGTSQVRTQDQRVVEGGADGGILTGLGLISWEGDLEWEMLFPNDHEIMFSPFTPDHLLFIRQSPVGCPDSVEGVINEVSPDDWSIAWLWRICARYTPHTRWPHHDHWSHLNAIEPFPRERAMLISSRFQSQLIRIDRDTNDIDWIVGYAGDFGMDSADVFHYQHAPEIQPDGNILLFDNGCVDRRPYSRAIELELTFDVLGTPLFAEVVWDYSDETLFSPARGDADRLPNGNTLIAYPNVEPNLESLLLEVNRGGEVVWRATTNEGVGTYRAERIEPFYGYTTITD